MSRSPSPSTSAISALIGPGEVLQHVALEAPAAQVLHPPRLALVVAELRDRQIEVAVAVEIAGAHVRHARNLVDEHAVRERLSPVVLEDDHRADLRVVGEEHAEAGDGDVEVAVAIEVHGARRAPGPATSASGLFGEPPRGRLPEPRDPIGGRVGDEDVGQPVAVEIGDRDVGDERPIVGADRRPDRLRRTGSRCVARGRRAPGFERSAEIEPRRPGNQLADGEIGTARLDGECGYGRDEMARRCQPLSPPSGRIVRPSRDPTPSPTAGPASLRYGDRRTLRSGRPAST